MLELTGEIPKLHRERELLYLLGKTVVEIEEPILKFIEKNKEKLRMLDEAYITSRYTLFTYSYDEAEMLVKLAEEIIQLLKEASKNVKNREIL